jgi:serine/threonine-protein kinase
VHAPPELTAGVLLDGRADVHALAGLLFELLTGHRPDPGPPQPPSALRPGLSAELDAVVLRGLAGDRDQRWTSPGGMAAAARAVLAAGGVEVARPADAPGPGPAAVGPAGRRRRTPGWAAAGGAVLAVLGAAALVHRRRLLRGLRRSRHLG